jgi:hypothetical protein
MRRITIVVAVVASLLLGLVVCRQNLAHASSPIGVKFIGVTNNAAGLLSTSDKVLAVFSVTNSAGSSFVDRGFYYVESSRSILIYSPLGSTSTLAPHGCATILTRIPTNPAPWRVIVPYSRCTAINRTLNGIRDALDRKRNRSEFDFERFGTGAPTSDWVKP